MLAADLLNRMLTKAGVELIRHPAPNMKRRLRLFKHYGINTLLDVGANKGDYVSDLRKNGFNGNAISFEPLSDTYQFLCKRAKMDTKWETVNIALGNKDEESVINISGNIHSSSILKMLPDHLKSSPESAYVGKEKIQIKKLDSIFGTYCQPKDIVFMKIDTQGFEMQVLEGAKNSLNCITGIQIEMSIKPLYEGAVLFGDIINHLNREGYVLMGIENGFSDPLSGQLLQMDGIFIR
jgi:FkbM family methyltransferase